MATLTLRRKLKLLEPFDHRIRWCALMFGFDVCHQIANAVEVAITLASRWITDGATGHFHLAPAFGSAAVDEPLHAALEVLCTLGVAPSLVKTAQLSQVGWGVAVAGMVTVHPAGSAADTLIVVAADTLIVVMVSHSRATVGWNMGGRRTVGRKVTRPRVVEGPRTAVAALVVVGGGAVSEGWGVCVQHAVVAAAAVAAAAR